MMRKTKDIFFVKLYCLPIRYFNIRLTINNEYLNYINNKNHSDRLYPFNPNQLWGEIISEIRVLGDSLISKLIYKLYFLLAPSLKKMVPGTKVLFDCENSTIYPPKDFIYLGNTMHFGQIIFRVPEHNIMCTA